LVSVGIAAAICAFAVVAFGSTVNSRCAAKLRAFFSALLVYSQANAGWTHPDPDHYVKFFGYRLSSEPGYEGEPPGWYDPGADNPSKSQRYAASVRDFCCSGDHEPRVNTHGYPYSQQINPSLVGVRLQPRPQGDVIAIAEFGINHVAPGGSSVRLVLFADGTPGLTSETPPWLDTASSEDSATRSGEQIGLQDARKSSPVTWLRNKDGHWVRRESLAWSNAWIDMRPKLVRALMALAVLAGLWFVVRRSRRTRADNQVREAGAQQDTTSTRS